MTDKRFKFICDDEKCFFKEGNKALYCYEVVDLLNSLYEENEQLKCSNKDAWDLIQFIYNEIKEDGSMDFGRVKDLVEFELTEKRFTNHDDTILDTDGEQLISTDEIVDKMNELHEENIMLKEKLNEILELTELTGMIHLRKAEIKSIIKR